MSNLLPTLEQAFEKGKQERRIQTACCGCTFAEIDEMPDHALPTQTGCSLGRLDKFASNGGEIIEATNEKENFFIIQDRICNTCRGEDWARLQEAKRPYDDLEDIVREEISLPCTAIVYFSRQHELTDLLETLDSLRNQTLLPKSVIIVNNVGDSPLGFVQMIRKEKLPFEWSVEFITEFQQPVAIATYEDLSPEEQEDYQIKAYYRCADLGITKNKNTYYVIFQAGYVLPKTYLGSIDIAINEDLKQVIAIVPDEGNDPLFIHNTLHGTLGGNKERPCIDKILDQAEKQECQHMIPKMSEILG